MLHRRLGRTNLRVSVIGIGGGAFAGIEKSTEMMKEVISYAVRRGVNFIETAEDYDETKIGLAIKGLRNDVVIASKSFSSSKKEMETSLRNSLKKIGTNHIEIYMLHTINSLEGLKFLIKNGVLDVLKKAKSNGIIDFIGLTGHRIPVLIEALKTGEFDVVEAPYSVGQTETERLFDVTKELDVGTIIMRPLGGGILVNRNKQKKISDVMNVENALAYALSNKCISTTLIGVSSVEHVKENIRTVNLAASLSESKRNEIEKNVKNFLGPNFCRGCLACMPCDEHGWKFGIDSFLRMETFYSKYGIKNVKDEYKKLDLKTTACTECGKCEFRCPYGVPIIKKLKILHKLCNVS